MMMIASRKRGIVIPRNEMKPKSVSTQLYCRVAAMIPSVMPNSDARMMAGQRQHDGARQALRHHLADRLVVVERVAEIEAGDDAADPVQVLHRQRVVEPVRLAIGIRLRLGIDVGHVALAHQHRLEVVGIVAGLGLDDAEGDH